jgi:two-component system response regulator AtoC
MPVEKNGHTILIGEDEPEIRAYLEMALKAMGYAVEMAEDGDEILGCLQSPGQDISAVLLDIVMPQRDGLDVLREIRRLAPALPVIMVSGAGGPMNVVTAMKSGATDFLSKPVSHDDLRTALAKALESRASYDIARPSAAPVAKTQTFLAASPNMQEIHSLIARIGWSEAPVLIQGETGSGKEVLARELHAHSPRSSKVFLKLNCAALPSELVESELFGYERGAFTGAFQRKAGMFETADGGTIFLDEIGDMDIRLQAKLLQVLQDHEFQRVGGKETIRVDVRVMAATHRDLEQAIEERAFREDLYYRLAVITVALPPLRERREDIVPLAEHFLVKHAVPGKTVGLTAELKHALITYHWPGNVRELENIMRRLIVLRAPDVVARELLMKTAQRPLSHVTAAASAGTPAARPIAGDDSGSILKQVSKAKEQAEAEAILAALHSTRWNRKLAASLLKIDYKALLYKMKKLGLDDDDLLMTSSSAEKPNGSLTRRVD